ncbi:MAG: DUF3179 domain-containing protein [Acidimicrobiia bacterium]|nr:DUF3179 domain-containing protein [Acidimicrobiia bacterium]
MGIDLDSYGPKPGTVQTDMTAPRTFTVALFLTAVACSSPTVDAPHDLVSATTVTTVAASPPAPAIPPGPLPARVVDELDTLVSSLDTDIDRDALRALADANDARVAWLIADLLRFLLPGPIQDDAIVTFEQLTDVDLKTAPVPWVTATNLLIGWDVPAPPDYVRWKGQLFSAIDDRWAPFFEPTASIDYRLLSWGGVRPDDRPFGDFAASCQGGCIPALDNPAVTDVSGGSWYPDDGVVFGIVLNGEARAYPKNILEVHEMVIDTVGAVRIGLPYCTLCGSAEAYDLASVPNGIDPSFMRTSGLLVRSNKLMFDLNTWSAIGTFTGVAVSGPLHDAGVELTQLSVVVSTWAEWKRTYPQTTIVAQDGGIGRSYEADPLGGRDANGPIFPIGPVDDRLPVQAPVLGVEAADGTLVAFPIAEVREQLAVGKRIMFGNIEVVAIAGGFTAVENGLEIVFHEAFWFAWSQFHPDTGLWQRGLDN